MVLSPLDQQLVAAMQDGLPLHPRPYAAIAAHVGLSENEVIRRIAGLQEQGVIKRFGVIVRHHELGYRANAMVVWDIPDDEVSELGARMGKLDCVTLCYRRSRRLPDWRYNLFCMIHGKSREAVLERINEIVDVLGLEGIPHAILFSGRRFKQRGARYVIGNDMQSGERVRHG